MIKSGQRVIWMIAVPLIVTLATSGCASKRYVRNQVNPVNYRVSALQAKTNDQVAYLNKTQINQQNEISATNERISTVDQKVSEVSSTAQASQGTASRAMDESTANTAKIEETNRAIATLGEGVANALNYQIVEKADVTFGPNQTALSPDAKIALDMIAMKVQSLPRTVVELVGFADSSGSAEHNLVLSQRRAEAVQRYLVMKNVPLRNIRIIGVGAEAPPANLEADLQAMVPNPTKAERSRLARRVHITVYGAGDITSGSAGRSQP